MSAPDPVQYIGQVERDCEGLLWAVLYIGPNVISRERVRSLRRGRRRITDMLLAAADRTSRPIEDRRPAAKNVVVIYVIGQPPKPYRAPTTSPPTAQGEGTP